ncbi:unnamed protein product [Cuscuta campestris]|uniref:F-box domain-containing protein n=1 Tax=Cuscuta campestris TaxID=132261 RepID=A0A484N762_9ASTE|nr:unnamed protein product [Cuscuta campestris]
MGAEEGPLPRRRRVELPEGILMEVFNRLPVKDIARCTVLSKDIYNLIHSHAFYRMWISANLQETVILFSERDNFSESDDDAGWNSIHSIDLMGLDQPDHLPPHLVEIPHPLAVEDRVDKMFLRGSVKGVLLLEIEKEGVGSRFQIWNPYLRLLGPIIPLPPGVAAAGGGDEVHYTAVGFGHSHGDFHLLLRLPQEEEEGAEFLRLTVRIFTLPVGGIQNQWTSVTSPFLLPVGSHLSGITTNPFHDHTVLWTSNHRNRWSVSGFNFENHTFIPAISFPLWDSSDGPRSAPTIRILGDRICTYCAATNATADAHPVVLYQLGDDGRSWTKAARFHLIFEGEEEDEDEPELNDMFRDFVAATWKNPCLVVYTSEDHIMGYDPENK